MSPSCFFVETEVTAKTTLNPAEFPASLERDLRTTD